MSFNYSVPRKCFALCGLHTSSLDCSHVALFFFSFVIFYPTVKPLNFLINQVEALSHCNLLKSVDSLPRINRSDLPIMREFRLCTCLFIIDWNSIQKWKTVVNGAERDTGQNGMEWNGMKSNGGNTVFEKLEQTNAWNVNIQVFRICMDKICVYKHGLPSKSTKMKKEKEKVSATEQTEWNWLKAAAGESVLSAMLY